MRGAKAISRVSNKKKWNQRESESSAICILRVPNKAWIYGGRQAKFARPCSLLKCTVMNEQHGCGVALV